MQFVRQSDPNDPFFVGFFLGGEEHPLRLLSRSTA